MIRRLLLVVTLYFIFISGIYAYEEYHQGELVRYNDIAFYVMFDSDSNEDSVQLLKMVPLSHDEINRYTDNKASLVVLPDNSLDYRASGSYGYYGQMAYYYGDNCYITSNTAGGSIVSSVKSGCKYDYESSNVKKVVDIWCEENFDNDDIVVDQDGYKARLISTGEALNLNLTPDAEATSSFSLNNAPEWFIKVSSGWTKDEGEQRLYSSNGTLYRINKIVFSVGKSFYDIDPDQSNYVRPTITLKKSSLQKAQINIYNNTKIREYKIGDIINYNDTKFYVIKNSGEKDSTLTVLKYSPLTKYELEKYGLGYINNYIRNFTYNAGGVKEVAQGEVIMEENKPMISYYSTDTCYGYWKDYIYSSNYVSDYSGCNYNYDISNVKHVVDNWFLDNINKNDSSTDSSGYNVRLINSDDLNNLGYISMQVSSDYNENSEPGNDTPEFMLDKNTSGMLTMILSYTNTDSLTSINSYAITVADDGYRFSARAIPNSAIGTVRPVVILKKKEIANKITNVEEIEDSDNVEVTVETEVENEPIKDSQIISVPDTLLRKSWIFILGIALVIIGIVFYINKKTE